MSISVLILTYNEERNIEKCINSVLFADEIVVLDSFSDDRTVDIAKNMGARVYQRKFDDFARQRNYGLEKCGIETEWVLHLDADERVTTELHEELQLVMKQSGFDAYKLPSKLIFGSQWLRYSGDYPQYQVRFGRTDKLKFIQVGHGQREAVSPEKIGVVKEPYLHYNFSKGLSEWFNKHNHYSDLEADFEIKNRKISREIILDFFSIDKMKRRRSIKHLSKHVPLKPLIRFLYMYIFRLGFLDGRAGLQYSILILIYEAMISVKKSYKINYNIKD